MPQGLVVFAKDKPRVSAFYRQTLGLEVRESDTSYDLLQGDGIEVTVHAIPAEFAKDIAIANPPMPREETPFKPTFVVADLAAVRREAAATGGHLNPESAAWTLGSLVVLDGWDPEGNIVQFRQGR